ncbi:hypothetical protein [Sulfolobus tengchongensis spindle-shaped virus 3]|nr:hypothetical protein [Sulfolobus tengchongensis spindle-shaped virus 3]
MEIGDPSFTLSGSREIENGDDSCSSLSLIKPSIELERRIINATKKNSTKEVFKLYKGAIHPHLREARLSAPLTPIFCNFWKLLQNLQIQTAMAFLHSAGQQTIP